MSDWKIAMLCIIPLMLGGHKPRAWLAVFLSSILAAVFALRPEAYLAIDLLCGFAVLMRPAGLEQKAIGMIFAGMAVIDVGYMLSPQADGGITFYYVLSTLGWLQFAILAWWGSHDTGKAIAGRFGRHRHSLARGNGVQ